MMAKAGHEAAVSSSAASMLKHHPVHAQRYEKQASRDAPNVSSGTSYLPSGTDLPHSSPFTEQIMREQQQIEHPTQPMMLSPRSHRHASSHQHDVHHHNSKHNNTGSVAALSFALAPHALPLQHQRYYCHQPPHLLDPDLSFDLDSRLSTAPSWLYQQNHNQHLRLSSFSSSSPSSSPPSLSSSTTSPSTTTSPSAPHSSVTSFSHNHRPSTISHSDLSFTSLFSSQHHFCPDHHDQYSPQVHPSSSSSFFSTLSPHTIGLQLLSMQPDQHSLPLQSHPLAQHGPPLPSMLNSLQQSQQMHQQPVQQQRQQQQNIRASMGDGPALNATNAYTSLPLHNAQPTLVMGLDRAGGLASVNSSQGLVLSHHQQQQPTQQLLPIAAHQQLPQQHYEEDANIDRYYLAPNAGKPITAMQQQQQQQQQPSVFHSPGSNKRKASYQHPGRPNPTMYPSPASSTTTPVLQSASISASMPLATLTHPSNNSTSATVTSSVMAPTVASNLPSSITAAPSYAPSSSGRAPVPALPIGQMSQMHLPPGAAQRLPNAPGNGTFLSTHPDSAEPNYMAAAAAAASQQPGSTDLYARHVQDAPLFAGTDVRGWSVYPNLGVGQISGVSESSSSAAGGLYKNSNSTGRLLPAFDVKAYTFRKKPRHYVAVKPKNALRIEPIIYLRTSIVDAQRNPVKQWDFLRFDTNRFRDNALPKKKLNHEEMKGAKILDVDIVLVSPNNGFRQIEESCPACVMRMDGERKIMQVLAKNFKMTPAGEPVIDIRKGHAIVCIKLNCYCDHHNESEGFVVRMQTHPETVRVGGSVKLRICCEARSKNGPQEQEQEEEDGLTDIDAPGSIGSRSPAPTNEQLLQSPSLSYGSPSPMVKGHGRTPSSTASSIASPRSFDERSVTGLGDHSSACPPPKFREIYPLTPSEGTCLGGTRVTIHGSNFGYLSSPIVVFFGEQPAELVMVSHDDVMECTTPPAQGLKPGLVQVKVASASFPEGQDTETADFLYMAPLDYDFCNLAAASLSFAMSGEYYDHNVNSLAALFGTQGSGLGDSLGLGLDGSGSLISGGGGFSWAMMQSMALDFLAAIKQLSPGKSLRAHRTEAGHTWLHLAVYEGMVSLVEELIRMGIDYTARAGNGRTALDLARTMASPSSEIISILENADVLRQEGAQAATASAAGQSPEHATQASSDSTSTEGQGDLTFSALIKKYEPHLRRICEEEQQRKKKAEEERAKRSRDLMAFRVKQHLALQQQQQAEEDVKDDEDDVMTEEEINDSDGSDSMEGITYAASSSASSSSLLSIETKTSRSSSPFARHKSPVSPSWSPRRLSSRALSDVISASRMNFIKTDIHDWESTRRHGIDQSRIDSIVSTLGISPAIQTWVCQDLVASDGSESPSTAPKPECIFALSATGVHIYPRATERASTMTGSSTEQSSQVHVKNWSLLEIEGLSVSLLPPKANADDIEQQQQDNEQQRTVGEVTIRFGDLSSSGEEIQFSSKSATELADMIAKRHQGVMRYLQLRPRIEPKLTSLASPPCQPQYQHQRPVEKDEEWLKTTLKIWCGICNVERVSWDHIEWKNNSQFRLLPPDDGAPMLNNSASFMVALLRTLGDLETCKTVDLSGNQLESDGWEDDSTLHELANTVRRMRQVLTWNLSGCHWRSLTAKTFLNALVESPQESLLSSSSSEMTTSYKMSPASLATQAEQHCVRLYLANNLLGDNGGGGSPENMGLFLTRIFEKLPDLCTLDLTNCRLKLDAVETLTHQLSNILDISLSQNAADDRWWQWMDVMIERNPELQRVSIGAPIGPSRESQSLLSLERLQSLPNLEELDLSGSSQLNAATLAVIEQLVEHRAQRYAEYKKLNPPQEDESSTTESHGRLRTISLGHCNLSWRQVTSLFQTICRTNTWSKFTLCLDKNPLFDETESAIQWKQVVSETQARVAFGINMADLILPNATVRELLEPLESATCLNELNLSGLCIMRENERGDLQGLSYDECWQRVRPTDASLDTCEVLRRVVENNSTLIMLDLSGGQMPRPQHGRRGGFGRRITAMFPALARNKTLRILSINRNGFGEDGLAQLAAALRTNQRLNVLDTAGNDAYTYKGLSTMEAILPPPHFQGTLQEAQQAGYNSTLAVWKTQMDEVMMHLDLMGREIQRLQSELLQAEKAHEAAKHSSPLRGASQHSKGTEITLKECHERVARAREDRTKYDQTLQNITQSTLANLKRIDAHVKALQTTAVSSPLSSMM